MIWVVSYDIPDDKRRRKVAELLLGYGRRAQYSVFECDLSFDKVERLERRMQDLIQPEEDDVRFYPLNRQDLRFVKMLGRAVLNRDDSHKIV